jgi:hypothetical protein
LKLDARIELTVRVTETTLITSTKVVPEVFVPLFPLSAN